MTATCSARICSIRSFRCCVHEPYRVDCRLCRVVWEAVVVAAAAAVAVVVVAAVVVVVVVAEDDMMIIPHHPPPIIGKYTLTLALVPHTPSLILSHTRSYTLPVPPSLSLHNRGDDDLSCSTISATAPIRNPPKPPPSTAGSPHLSSVPLKPQPSPPLADAGSQLDAIMWLLPPPCDRASPPSRWPSPPSMSLLHHHHSMPHLSGMSRTCSCRRSYCPG